MLLNNLINYIQNPLAILGLGWLMNRYFIWVMIAVAASAVFALTYNQTNRSTETQDSGQSLIAPAFAQNEDVSFLYKEAGIAAYVNLGKEISLPASSDVLNGEPSTNSYVKGLIRFPEQEPYNYAKYFVHKNGWIVVYYPKDAPSAKIVDIKNYGGGVLKTNNLQLGIDIICEDISQDNCKASYYHFQYNKANRILLSVREKGSMTVTIPSDTTVYEKSITMPKATPSYCDTGITVGGQLFRDCTGGDLTYIIPSNVMKTDEPTTIGYGTFAFSAVYKE